MDIQPNLIERIVRKISVDDAGCWRWSGTSDDKGYGLIRMGGKGGVIRKAHRMAYEAFRESVPEDLELDHLCRVRECVNPWHLQAVTHKENMARGAHAMKTHCPHGHEYSPRNTYVNPRGSRECRTCRRERRA